MNRLVYTHDYYIVNYYYNNLRGPADLRTRGNNIDNTGIGLGRRARLLCTRHYECFGVDSGAHRGGEYAPTGRAPRPYYYYT